ncbi:hypothetical protein E2C01_033262 [Portunus trituberculatus]|uniref:Uncharacterized protein n=1 Tax=Portunus trituberculatus TaxID=210409 RepID=A0A5B7F1Z4_PORTR|nr:hypothetical protein [Portunus trituberculatus]
METRHGTEAVKWPKRLLWFPHLIIFSVTAASPLRAAVLKPLPSIIRALFTDQSYYAHGSSCSPSSTLYPPPSTGHRPPSTPPSSLLNPPSPATSNLSRPPFASPVPVPHYPFRLS